MQRFVGLMSGTSLDGVDGVVTHGAMAPPDSAGWAAAAHVHVGFSAPLRAELLALNHPGPNELHRAALAANALMHVYADAVARLLSQTGAAPGDITAIGAHGQTVRHRPGEFDGTGYTLQLMNGALLAELSGIDVVCDLRSRDVAAGGQGAPLVPAFHAACFGLPGRHRAVLNLGGIANLTVLPADGAVTGFDCGPANVLLDAWALRHLGQPYDPGGSWAAGGRVDEVLLQRLLREPYFSRPPPKSTGRDLFDIAWLDRQLGGSPQALPSPQDAMATLAELTARTVADALLGQAAATQQLWVCGGGAYNTDLMARLAACLPTLTVQSSAACGMPPDQVEALAFAWMADAYLQRRVANLPGVTGARGLRLLGALYPAGSRADP